MTRTPDHSFRAEGLRVAYDSHVVIDGLDIEIPAGQVTVIVGANASGKSTLLRTLARILAPAQGRVLLDERDIRSYSGREFARVVGILPQSPIAPEGITVADLVTRGRYPHQGWFGRRSSDDDRIALEALTATDCIELADRPVESLSGGQRQRAWIAMALAQDPDILLLDEPTTYLDVTHQLEVLDLLHSLNRAKGTTVVMVLHDLNMAARYADHVVVMAGGDVVASGAPAEVITAETVRLAFALDAHIMVDPVAGSPMVVPLSRVHPLTEASVSQSH